ncbi:ion channel [Pseudotabrizicola sp. L79]|uniref:ion channel n=1 Tax=Pseudotabrizicola sp. L79 TaxID=3118402 RepID=UPI002F92502C
MILQIVIGSGLLLLSIVIAASSALVLEWLFQAANPWLMREPHRPKLVLLLIGVSVWVLGVITAGVWLWAFVFLAVGALPTLEEAVYFSLVSYTTLGFGDVLLPREWRILSGMAGANGFLNFGLLTALMVEALRHVRVGQHEVRRQKR